MTPSKSIILIAKSSSRLAKDVILTPKKTSSNQMNRSWQKCDFVEIFGACLFICASSKGINDDNLIMAEHLCISAIAVLFIRKTFQVRIPKSRF